MKKASLIILLIFLLSCSDDKTETQVTYEYKEYPFTVIIKNSKGWSVNYNYIECDSFQFINNKEIWIWAEGTKMKAIAGNYVTVRSN